MIVKDMSVSRVSSAIRAIRIISINRDASAFRFTIIRYIND
jgi:hypothetical protein